MSSPWLVALAFLFIVVRRPRFTFSKVQIGAALANSATMFLFIYANKATTSANAILLQYGSPVYVAIAGAFILKERPRAEHLAALGRVLRLDALRLVVREPFLARDEDHRWDAEKYEIFEAVIEGNLN